VTPEDREIYRARLDALDKRAASIDFRDSVPLPIVLVLDVVVLGVIGALVYSGTKSWWMAIGAPLGFLVFIGLISLLPSSGES
jgi:fatty acid desaturase